MTNDKARIHIYELDGSKQEIEITSTQSVNAVKFMYCKIRNIPTKLFNDYSLFNLANNKKIEELDTTLNMLDLHREWKGTQNKLLFKLKTAKFQPWKNRNSFLKYDEPVKEVDSAELLMTDTLEFLSRRGADEEGIFRICGNHSQILQMLKRYDEGKKVDSSVEFKDPHTVAGLLKAHLRVSPLPQTFVQKLKDIDRPAEIPTIQQNLSSLPPSTLGLFQKFFALLKRIVDNSSTTKMDLKNLWLIFSGIFEKLDMETFELLIHQSDIAFQPFSEKPNEIIIKPTFQKPDIPISKSPEDNFKFVSLHRANSQTHNDFAGRITTGPLIPPPPKQPTSDFSSLPQVTIQKPPIPPPPGLKPPVPLKRFTLPNDKPLAENNEVTHAQSSGTSPEASNYPPPIPPKTEELRVVDKRARASHRFATVYVRPQDITRDFSDNGLDSHLSHIQVNHFDNQSKNFDSNVTEGNLVPLQVAPPVPPRPSKIVNDF